MITYFGEEGDCPSKGQIESSRVNHVYINLADILLLYVCFNLLCILISLSILGLADKYIHVCFNL